MTVSAQEAAALLRRRERSRLDAERAHADQTREGVISTLRGALVPGERAWLIGSLAWGGFGVRSDVDVVLDQVSAERSLVLEVLLASVASAPVDLLTLADLPMSFRERVEREGLSVP